MDRMNLKPVSANAVFQSAFPQQFKPKDGEAYRLWLPEIDNLYRAKTHYLRPNYVFCLQAPENGINKPCPACMAGDYPRFRYGMNVLVYKTDTNGKLRPVVKEIDGKPVDSVDWEVQLWLFSQSVANDLYTIASMYETDKDWPFKHDVKVLCLDRMRGKYSIQAYPDAVFTDKENIQELILSSLKAGRRDPVRELGVVQSQEELAAAVAAGALQQGNNKDQQKKGGNGGELRAQSPKRFPVAEVREASLGSPSVLAPEAGHSESDKKLADETIEGHAKETTRDISNDGEFKELLDRIKNQKKKAA